MRRRSNPRHAIGRPPVAARRGSYDADQRRQAAHLDQREPAWLIWWGVGTHRYYAMPLRDGVRCVDARTIEELAEEMRAAEDARTLTL